MGCHTTCFGEHIHNVYIYIHLMNRIQKKIAQFNELCKCRFL